MNFIKSLQRKFTLYSGVSCDLGIQCNRDHCPVCNAENYQRWMTDSHQIVRKNSSFAVGIRAAELITILLNRGSVSDAKQLRHSWSPTAKSPNILMSEEDPLQFLRLPEPHSTDAIRGKVGYSHGVHVWRLLWPEAKRGTHATIGVSTDRSLLQYDAYVPLVGLDSESWGWDIVNLRTSHDLGGDNPFEQQPYPLPKYRNGLKRNFTTNRLRIGEIITMILDMGNGTLSFMLNRTFLGVAFTGLKGKTLYVTAGCVWGHCKVELRYHGSIQGTLPNHFQTLFYCEYAENIRKWVPRELSEIQKKTPPSLLEIAILQSKQLLENHCNYNIEHCRHWLKNEHRINTDSTSSNLISKLRIPENLKPMLLKFSNKPFSLL